MHMMTLFSLLSFAWPRRRDMQKKAKYFEELKYIATKSRGQSFQFVRRMYSRLKLKYYPLV